MRFIARLSHAGVRVLDIDLYDLSIRILEDRGIFEQILEVEAETEKAVLLLDEADSFLRSRRMAERNYEVSEVNEMLQGMERYAGIFICTTNLFHELDEAALRRFTFKIRFKPLTATQRERMFVVEALQGDAVALSGEQRARLGKLDDLAAGDFAAVRRQADLQPAQAGDAMVVLAAARLGATRLIDNLEV